MQQYRTFWLLLTMMLVGGFTLTSCVDNKDDASEGGSGDNYKNYVERMYPVVDPQNSPQGMVMLRFYNDMPSVAYVSISNFQSIMYPGTTVQVVKTAEHQYALASPCGTDALPIIRWKSLDASPKQVDVTLDYGKYGIDIREDGENVYFPFATIADLYTDSYMHMADFNGEAVMVAPDGSYSLENGYPSFFITPILKETRTADMADFAYRNLCFTLTNTVTLGCLLNDGGHTNTDVTRMSDFSGNPTFLSTLNGIIDAKWGEFWDICPEYVPIYENLVGRITLANHLNEARAKALGEGVNYYKVGNTAYCQFGTFLCDDSGWRKFYKGEGPKPTIDQYPNDWLVILVDALEKAQNDPEVKNFILDISTNGGGSSDIVLFITSLFANKSDLYYENVLTGQKMKSTFEVDRNLDGKFDEKDKDVKLRMNIGVLTSTFSFSCGNLLPALLKDYGICLLGKKSGGGSCAVLYSPSADGFGFTYSTHRNRLNNLKGENIDEGIEPDYPLEVDEFFDIPKIGKLIEDFYSR